MLIRASTGRDRSITFRVPGMVILLAGAECTDFHLSGAFNKVGAQLHY